jgi:hypothetical protein
MTPNHILSRYERCRDALPNIRAVGKLSFWLSCLYVADHPRTIRDLAAVAGMTYSQAKVHIQLMKRNQLVTVTSCSKTHPGSIFMHTANERMLKLLGFTNSPAASKGEWMQSLYHDSAHFMRDGQAACAAATNGVHSTPGTAWFKHDGHLRKCMRCMKHANDKTVATEGVAKSSAEAAQPSSQK